MKLFQLQYDSLLALGKDIAKKVDIISNIRYGMKLNKTLNPTLVELIPRLSIMNANYFSAHKDDLNI